MHNLSYRTPYLSLFPKAVSSDFLKFGKASDSKSRVIENALQQIGIIETDETLVSYTDISEWHRGGAETYISDFKVLLKTDLYERREHIIAKAIVKWGTTAELTVIEWLNRVRRLNAFGVNTPHVWHWNGVLFQQFIRFSLTDYIHAVNDQEKHRLCRQLLRIAEQVDRAGFSPTNIIDDIRTDGTELFVVDVGEDLGHFSENQHGAGARNFIWSWIDKKAWFDVSELGYVAEGGKCIIR